MKVNLATDKYRWLALVFLALGLAIVIIDNTVLNVAIPHIMRDLGASLDAIQWVISGYALIIATLLITMGRLADQFGRKKLFLIGTCFFAVGSFIASYATNVLVLFIGEAFIEAIGASMMLTSTLSLLVTEFQGKERAIAFGVWGSVAGASAALGPMLGGYFTTFHSWRWSLRINVIVALVAILGSVFIKESKGAAAKHFDWGGMILSGLGLFCLVFGFIEGKRFGWGTLIQLAFAGALVFLTLFAILESRLEKKGRSPLLKLSMFKVREFTISLLTLGIVSMGQFSIFFIMPIYLQNNLHRDAFHTGIVLLWCSLCAFVAGPTAGGVAARIGPRRVAVVGMFILAAGAFLLMISATPTATGLSLAPGLMLLGVGIGITSSQLTNIVLSSAPIQLAGEASATNTTIRQVGTSIGIAVIGTVVTTSVHGALAIAFGVILLGALFSLLIPARADG